MEEGPGKYHIPKGEREGEVLPNKLNISDPEKLGKAEADGFSKAELSLIEELTDETTFDVDYIRNIHFLALSHLYKFAGEYRSVNISKGGFMFAAAHVIPDVMQKFESEVLLNLPHHYQDKEKLIYDIGKVHAELLFVHPFRDGNGRTMRILANLMSFKQGYGEINFELVKNDEELKGKYFKCVQAAGEEKYQPMVSLIGELFG